MSQHARVWTVFAFMAVLAVIGLYHMGMNVGAGLGGFVRSAMHLFGIPVAP